MGWIDVLPGIRKIPSEDKIAEATERLADLLEADFPGARTFCRLTIRPSLMGWLCAVGSTVQRMPGEYEAAIWGSQINVDRMARQLRSPLQWFVPRAKAHELACDILGDGGVQKVLKGGFSITSSLNYSVTYVVTWNSISLYNGKNLVGSFCLQAKGSYPPWDVILSRIFMIQGSELDFLMTAVFIDAGGSSYSGKTMTREQFLAIYGKGAIGQWDNYMSSTRARVIAR